METSAPSRNRWMWPSFGTSFVEVTDTIFPPTRPSRTGTEAGSPWNIAPAWGERICRRATALRVRIIVVIMLAGSSPSLETGGRVRGLGSSRRPAGSFRGSGSGDGPRAGHAGLCLQQRGGLGVEREGQRGRVLLSAGVGGGTGRRGSRRRAGPHPTRRGGPRHEPFGAPG